MLYLNKANLSRLNAFRIINVLERKVALVLNYYLVLLVHIDARLLFNDLLFLLLRLLLVVLGRLKGSHVNFAFGHGVVGSADFLDVVCHAALL